MAFRVLGLIASRREVVARGELREGDTVESVPLSYSFRRGLLMSKGRGNGFRSFSKEFQPFRPQKAGKAVFVLLQKNFNPLCRKKAGFANFVLKEKERKRL